MFGNQEHPRLIKGKPETFRLVYDPNIGIQPFNYSLFMFC